MKNILILPLLFLAISALAQADPAILNQKLDDLKIALEKLKGVIDSQKDEIDTASVLYIKKFEEIIVYDNDNYPKDTIEIKKIVFDVRDGLILDIQVISTTDRIFSNYWAPIAITRFNSCKWLSSIYLIDEIDTSKRNKKNKSRNAKDTVKIKQEHWYINTCDFLNIVRKGIAVPDNHHFELTKRDTVKVLTRGTGINQIVDLRIYSDMFAALGDEPNGIAQIEGSSRIFINNKNVFNRSTTPFRYGYFSIQASKFDSKFQVTELDSSFTRLKAIQRSAVSVDFGLNLMGLWLQSKSRSWASLNGGVGMNLVRLSNKSDTTTVGSQFLFLESLFEFKELRNFGVDFNGRVFWQRFTGLEKPQSEVQAFLRLGATAYWNPMKNPASRIFARVNYYQNLNAGEEPFVQIQLGYSAVISSLLSNGKN